jgi:hypothetical protein
MMFWACWGLPLRAAHDGVDAGDQFLAIERLGQIVVGANAVLQRFSASTSDFNDFATIFP